MNITIQSDLNVNQSLFEIRAESKRMYKPCTMCNNTRKVKVTDHATGKSYSVKCPKCEGKRIKGEESSLIEFTRYSMREHHVGAITWDREKAFFNTYRNLNEYGLHEVSFFDIPLPRFVGEHDKIEIYDMPKHYLWVNKDDCRAEVQRLNATEKAKVDEFLKGQEGIEE